MMDTEKIISAMNVLSDFCAVRHHCKGCPLNKACTICMPDTFLDTFMEAAIDGIEEVHDEQTEH